MHGWSKSDTDGKEWKRAPPPSTKQPSNFSPMNNQTSDEHEILINAALDAEVPSEIAVEVPGAKLMKRATTITSSYQKLIPSRTSRPATATGSELKRVTLPVSCVSALPTVSMEPTGYAVPQEMEAACFTIPESDCQVVVETVVEDSQTGAAPVQNYLEVVVPEISQSSRLTINGSCLS